MTQGYRRLLKWMRALHIYVTLFGLLLLLFFAVTGFMLNHEDWFGLDEPRRETMQGGTLPTALLAEADEETLELAVTEWVRREYGATGQVDEFRAEADSLTLGFKAPGRQTEATIDRTNGQVEVVHETTGLAGRLTDLHRGKGSGDAWALIIDGVAVLVLIISATGLFLWTTLRTRRQLGVTALVLGITSFVAAYFLLVP